MNITPHGRMSAYAPVAFTTTQGGPITLNAFAITAVSTNNGSISTTTVIRTIAGEALLVRESYDHVNAEIAAAIAAASGPPAEAKPLELTRKGKGDK